MDFSRLYAPSHLRDVSDTGNQRDHILTGSAEPGEIRFFDLPHIEHLIDPCAESGGVGDFIAVLQGMDLPKVIGNASVVTGKPHISIPARGGFEVSCTLGQTLKALNLIDLDGQSK